MALATGAVHAEYPQLWNPHERLSKPSLADIPRLRFLTTVDFPPFNHLDSSGRLAGFHVDLVNAICRELEILEKCQIQAVPWAELVPMIEKRQAEAIIAGISPDAGTQEALVFTRSYFPFPARLVVRKDTPVNPKELAGKRIGVIERSGHEAMLAAFFPEARAVRYSREDWMLDDLKDGKVDAVLSDGMRLSFWIGGADSEACCAFAGGTYLSPELLGSGLQIAVSAKLPNLVPALDLAIKELSINGTMNELYLRYFPTDFF